MDKTKGRPGLSKYIFILIVSFSFIFMGTLSAGKNQAEFNLLFNKIKGKIKPAIFNKLNKAKDKLVREIDLMKRNYDYLRLAKKQIATTSRGLAGLDVSEAAFLVLQIAMERRSKIIQTLSNILKKISDTQQGLISNTK